MPSWVEILGFVTGAACVWLLVKENLWNWPVGIVNNLLFLVLFFRSGLYADSGLQLVFIALSLYGWWNWLRGGGAKEELAISRTPRAAGIALAALGTGFTVALGVFLDRATPSTVPYSDALTTALSLVAIYLQAKKWIETWHVWIAADVVYIALYFYKGLALTALLYVVFLGMCVVGLREWRRQSRSPEATFPRPSS